MARFGRVNIGAALEDNHSSSYSTMECVCVCVHLQYVTLCTHQLRCPALWGRLRRWRVGRPCRRCRARWATGWRHRPSCLCRTAQRWRTHCPRSPTVRWDRRKRPSPTNPNPWGPAPSTATWWRARPTWLLPRVTWSPSRVCMQDTWQQPLLHLFVSTFSPNDEWSKKKNLQKESCFFHSVFLSKKGGN